MGHEPYSKVIQTFLCLIIIAIIIVIITNIINVIVTIMMKRNDTAQTGQSFSPRCEERPDCGSTKVESDCLCSGIFFMSIYDDNNDDDDSDNDDNDDDDNGEDQ